MTAMWYKWYCHLRSKGYNPFTSLYCAWYNTKISPPYWTKENGYDVPQRWIDNRDKYYRG